MSAVFSYNGYEFIYARTLSFSMQQEYDPTDTDAIRNHYLLRIRGFVQPNVNVFASLATGTVLAQIKAHLLTPRRPLYYDIAGVPQIAIVVAPDAKLGPIPKSCEVTTVNSGFFLVDFTVECWTVNCDTDCNTPDPVLSLRWTQTETYDQNWNSHLKTKGLLIVRADLLQCADNFRPQTVPPILPDYQRQAASYTLSPDGLQLEFEYDDQEVDRLPPDPATKARGSYSVTVKHPGSIRHGTVDLALEGPKGVNRRTLMVRAIDMAYSKLQRDTFATRQAPVWSGQFDEDLFEPKVRVRITAMMSPILKKSFTGIVGALRFAGTTAADALRPPAPSVMPSVGVDTLGLRSGRTGLTLPARKRLAGLLVAAFRDPCACVEDTVELTSTGSPPFPTPNSSITNPTSGPSVPPPATITVGPVSLNTSPTIIDTAPYNNYTIVIATHIITGAIQLPGTGVGSQGSVSKVVTASGPKMVVTTSWTASRTGAAPQKPTFYAPNSNMVALEGNIVAEDVTPSPDGADLIYSMAGYYVHAVLDPSKYQIAPGVAPFYGPDVQQGALNAGQYWSDLPVWYQENNTPAGEQPLVPGGVSAGAAPQPPTNYPNQAGSPGSGGTGTPGGGSDGGGGQYFVPPVGP